MTNENPRGLPVACLVTGGKAFCDRAFVDMQQAMHSIEQRKDGARLEPLVLATDYAALQAEVEALRADAARLDYIERTFSGMTNRERYLPVQMIWGKGCNGRTLREACDKYMARAAIAAREGR